MLASKPQDIPSFISAPCAFSYGTRNVNICVMGLLKAIIQLLILCHIKQVRGLWNEIQFHLSQKRTKQQALIKFR
jgi:hypothetical protein